MFHLTSTNNLMEMIMLVSFQIKREQRRRHDPHDGRLFEEIDRWIKTLPSNLENDGIAFIHHPHLYRVFLQRILSAEYNFDSQRGFIVLSNAELDPNDHEKMMSRLAQFKRQTRHKRFEKVCIVRGWYGCGHEEMSQITTNGFFHMTKLGEGDNDKGFCLKSSAQSAARDAGPLGCVIMCYVILHNPFPTIISDGRSRGYPNRYRYYSDGKHRIDQWEYLPMETSWRGLAPPSADDIKNGLHDEFVTYQAKDILPQAVVYLRTKVYRALGYLVWRY